MTTLLEKCGYLKCQIDITALMFNRHKVLYMEIKKLRLELDVTEGLERLEMLSALSRLQGEQEALRHLWLMIAALSADENALRLHPQ